MVTVAQLKAYLRLPSADTEYLTGFLQAAKAKARSAGIPEFQNNALYDQFLLQFAGLLYESRSLGTEADPAKVQSLINSFVLPLRYMEDGEEPEPEPEPDPDPDPDPEATEPTEGQQEVSGDG